MKNPIKTFGIIAIAALIGFSFVACGEADNGDTSHVHSYGSWQSNSTSHWKQCDCGEEYGRGNHDGNPCIVCGFNASGSTHTHSYGSWQSNSTSHWRVCSSCGEEDGRGNHSGNPCTVCGYNTGTNPGTNVPGTPSGVTAARNPAGSTTIRVSWFSVSGATSYKVYYSLTNSGSGTLDGTSTTTSYTSTGNSTESTWYFRVTAVNSAGEGSPSSWVSVASVAAVPGSSSSNAITIPSSGINGSFPAGLDAVWYKFTKFGSGSFSASDKEYSSTYTADIVVDIYNESLSLMSGPIYNAGSYVRNGNWESIDVGKSESTGYSLFATNWFGTYYVKVRPYNNDITNKGSFALLAP